MGWGYRVGDHKARARPKPSHRKFRPHAITTPPPPSSIRPFCAAAAVAASWTMPSRWIC